MQLLLRHLRYQSIFIKIDGVLSELTSTAILNFQRELNLGGKIDIRLRGISPRVVISATSDLFRVIEFRVLEFRVLELRVLESNCNAGNSFIEVFTLIVLLITNKFLVLRRVIEHNKWRIILVK